MLAFDLTTAHGRAAFDAHRWAYEDRWSVPMLVRAVAVRMPLIAALELAVQDAGGSIVYCTRAELAAWRWRRPTPKRVHRHDQRAGFRPDGRTAVSAF